jgi:hypothetical protein
MTWAFDNERSRQAMENSIRRTMDYPSQAGIALAGFQVTTANGTSQAATAQLSAEQPGIFPMGQLRRGDPARLFHRGQE